VEAISLDDPATTAKPDMTYVGINQNKANRYIEAFMSAGQMSAMFKGSQDAAGPIKVNRERQIGASKIDFVVNDCVCVEVKVGHELSRRGL
jgi:sugar fermentation stimulation protein A